MTRPPWREKLRFGESTHIEHPVGGVPTRFYPLSLGMMFKLKGISKPLGKAISILFTGDKHDRGTIYREVGAPAVDGNGRIIKIGLGGGTEQVLRDSENISEAISPALAELRMKQRTDAIDMLINAVTEQENLEFVAEIIMDSLRMLPRSERPSASEFLQEIELPLLSELLMGVWEANKGAFGSLGKRAEAVLRSATAGQGTPPTVGDVCPTA